jgi:DNA helicase HerA-like ATPase
VGVALVSFLDEKGAPRMVERVFILPPASQLGPIDAAERKAAIDGSVVAGVYEKTVDRESAYEQLNSRLASTARTGQDRPAATTRGDAPQSQPAPQSQQAPAEDSSIFGDVLGGLFGKSGKRDTAVQAMVKSAARSIGSQVGREIIRGVLGSILKKR